MCVCVCVHRGNIGPLCLIFSLLSSAAAFCLDTSWLSIRRNERDRMKVRSDWPQRSVLMSEDRLAVRTDDRPHHTPPALPGPGRRHNEGVDNNTKTEGLGTVFSIVSSFYILSLALSHSLFFSLAPHRYYCVGR